jgi:hypothetical protein
VHGDRNLPRFASAPDDAGIERTTKHFWEKGEHINSHASTRSRFDTWPYPYEMPF